VQSIPIPPKLDLACAPPCLPAPRRDDSRRATWVRLAEPLALLCLEVAALTPFVEFTGGPLAYLADSRICTGLLFALVAFLLLAGGRIRDAGAGSFRRSPRWLAVHLGLYGGFFLLTLWLARGGGSGTPVWAAVVWGLLVLGVGLSGILAFQRPRVVATWARQFHLEIGMALGLGVALVLLTPLARSLWPQVYGPALAIDEVLLEWTYGEGLAGRTREGYPVVGTRQLLLIVTPQCSELDALAAFWLLGGAVLLSRWRSASKVRSALVLLLGAGLLYLLNSIRLYGLVVLGIAASPNLCVGLAHSRISWLLFLGVGVSLLAASSGWCQPNRQERAADPSEGAEPVPAAEPATA
jgi:exosortase/archaeosortase family protein